MGRALATIQAHGGNVSAASRELGINRATLGRWNSGQRRRPRGEAAKLLRTENLTHQRLSMASDWLEVTKMSLDRLREALVAGTIKPHDLIVLAGVGQDKILALLGGRAASEVNVTVTLADYYRKHLPSKVITTALPSEVASSDPLTLVHQVPQLTSGERR